MSYGVVFVATLVPTETAICYKRREGLFFFVVIAVKLLNLCTVNPFFMALFSSSIEESKEKT